MAALSEFIVLMRSIIGDDEEEVTLREYSDAQLKGWLSVAFKLGRVPAGYTFDAVTETVTPDPASGDDWALIVLRACQTGVMPREAQYSYRTRPLAVTAHGKGRRDLLLHLSNELHRVESGGACAFAGQQDLLTWLLQTRSNGSVLEGSTVDPPAAQEVSY